MITKRRRVHHRCRALPELTPPTTHKKEVGCLLRNTQHRRVTGGDGAIRLASEALAWLIAGVPSKASEAVYRIIQTYSTHQAKARAPPLPSVSKTLLPLLPHKKVDGCVLRNTKRRRVTGGDGAIRLASGALARLIAGVLSQASEATDRTLKKIPSLTESFRSIPHTKQRRVHHRCRASPNHHSTYHQPKR